MKKFIITEENLKTLLKNKPKDRDTFKSWLETLDYLDTNKAYTIISPLISPQKR